MQQWKGAWGSDGKINVADLNGDGMSDVFMWRNTTQTWMVNLSTGKGFEMQEWTGAWGSDGPINMGDLNGDGMSDIFMWRDASKTWTVNFSTGSGFNMQEWSGAWGSDGTINVGDLNGDGKSDVFMWRDGSKSWTINLSTGMGFNMQEWIGGAWGSDGPINVGDLNGDGKTDVFMWRDASKSWTVNLSSGIGFNMQEWRGAWGSDGPINVGDLNGDGKTDVFMWRDASKSWTINLSIGIGFNMQEWRGAWGSDGPIYIGDLNADKTSDVFMWRDTDKSWTVNLSSGSGFLQQKFTGAWGSDGPTFTSDLNGDKKVDIFMWRDIDKTWTINLSSSDAISTMDIDQDGIPNYVEDELMVRFRPYYKFSIDNDGLDPYHPTDALWFIQNSDLLEKGRVLVSRNQLSDNPGLILTASGDVDVSSDYKNFPNKTGYELDLPDAFRKGEEDWNRIQTQAIGLYGHITPLHEDNNNQNRITAYRIEYWQFYAFNDAPLDDYRHEGDWETVQLIVEDDLKTIRTVIHNVHGNEVVFEISQGKMIDAGNGVIEYHGTGPLRPHTAIDLYTRGPAGIGWAQNNLLFFFCSDGECTHPVVYIEHSGHASWPTKYWSWTGARKHFGDGSSYLVSVPPNLGELHYPDWRCPGADLILHFNGAWGAYNDSPPGPTFQSWGH